MAGKGRRKTGKMLVEDKSARLVCFSKRRLGLFKKAEELAVLTGAQVGAIVFSPAGKPMAFNTASLEALISAHVLQEESRSGDDWESRYHRYRKGEAASDWWKRSDVHSMGLEEARRFESAILTNRKKRPFDEMAGELTSLAVESSFNPQTVDDNMKKKKKKKKMKLSVECPMNESLPSSYSVDATFMPGQDILDEIASYLQSSPVLLPFSDILPALSSDGSSFSGEATIDSIDFSCRSLTWDQFPEQQLLVQWNDECLVNASLPWDDFPEFQQQLSEAHFMEASLPQSFSDLEPMADNLNSLGASFSHSEQPAEAMDNSIISIPCIESLEQQLMADDWPMIDILSNDAFQENQSSLGQTVVSLDQAPIADSFSSEDVMGTSFSPLPYFESFEQQLWDDD